MAKRVICGAGLLLLGFGGSIVARASQPQDPDVLSALLTEVRGLRQAMEQMASGGPRVQLALGRLQLQEQRVNTMIRRLETVREAVARAEKEVATSETSMAPLLKMFGTEEAPAGEDHPMSAMLEALKKGIAAGHAEVQRLRLEEAQIQQEIATEQGRWGEINRALEELERTFTKR